MEHRLGVKEGVRQLEFLVPADPGAQAVTPGKMRKKAARRVLPGAEPRADLLNPFLPIPLPVLFSPLPVCPQERPCNQ